MGTFVDSAIVDYRLPITNCAKQFLIAEFRLPPSSDYRLSIMANKRKLVDYRSFPRFRDIFTEISWLNDLSA